MNLFQATSHIQSAGSAARVMGANVKLAEAMGETAKTMGQMNKVMDPEKLAGTMREFEMANAKMSMTEETSENSFKWPEKELFLC
jgi:charged multivesicular body protein 2B